MEIVLAGRFEIGHSRVVAIDQFRECGLGLEGGIACSRGGFRSSEGEMR